MVTASLTDVAGGDNPVSVSVSLLFTHTGKGTVTKGTSTLVPSPVYQERRVRGKMLAEQWPVVPSICPKLRESNIVTLAPPCTPSPSPEFVNHLPLTISL